MKTSFVLVILSTLCATQATTTISCSAGCPASPAADETVTRSDEPVSSCTAASLTAVYNSGASSTPSLVTPGQPDQPTPTVVGPSTGAAGKLVGGSGAAIVAAAMAAYLV